MTTTETIEVSYLEFHERMRDIVAANGLVTRMEVKPESYVLTVTWPENTAGGVTDKQAATPPVQHDSDDTPPMTQAEP